VPSQGGMARLSWPCGWLRNETVYLPKGSRPSHPSTNRAQCRATALIETNAVTLHQTATNTGRECCHLKGLSGYSQHTPPVTDLLHPPAFGRTVGIDLPPPQPPISSLHHLVVCCFNEGVFYSEPKRLTRTFVMLMTTDDVGILPVGC